MQQPSFHKFKYWFAKCNSHRSISSNIKYSILLILRPSSISSNATLFEVVRMWFQVSLVEKVVRNTHFFFLSKGHGRLHVFDCSIPMSASLPSGLSSPHNAFSFYDLLRLPKLLRIYLSHINYSTIICNVYSRLISHQNEVRSPFFISTLQRSFAASQYWSIFFNIHDQGMWFP